MKADQGKCLCGAVSIQAGVAERHHEACHCGMCRRWSGGPFFGTVVSTVSFEGEENIARYASSEWAERGFCKLCGTHLFYRLKKFDSYVMSVGLFDDAERFILVEEIFIDRKPDGYSFAGDHPRLSEAETLAKYMPEE